MNQSPFISVVIPVKKLTYYLLFENLPGMARQTYKKFEVIVLPDENTQYDLELLKQYKWLKIIGTGLKSRPADKRDTGVKHAKGTIIAFLDDDAYPDPRWLEKAASVFKKNKVEAVCGPGVIPESANRWERIFDEVFKSWIGSGGYAYRFTLGTKRYVADFPSMNFLILKKMFVKIGGFNSEYWPGEDSKLCNDLIVKQKGKILYHPEILVYHHRRNTLQGYIRQHANYGFHRGAFFAHGDENSRSFGYLVPSLFVLYFLLLIPALVSSAVMYESSRINIYILFPLAIYCILSTYLFIRSLLNTQSLVISAGAVYVLFLTHIVYGVSFLKGYIKGKKKGDNIYE